MIVRNFLQWVRTAPAGERADATAALARASLYSDLSSDDLGAAEGAMLMLLDDPSPLVRRALADVLAASPDAPPAIVFALSSDQPRIASRAPVPRSVASAIAEVGTAEACLMLVESGDADLAPLSIDRIVERF